MMKRLLLLLIACVVLHGANAQPGYQLVLRDEIRINMPATPEHQALDSLGKESYMVYANGCLFAVGIVPNAIEDYLAYRLASDTERIARAQELLQRISAGKLGYRKQHLISMNSFRTSHKYVGLDVEYMTMEPSDPASRKRFSMLLLIGDTVYIVDCWYMDDAEHDAEKDAFYKSIQIKG